MKCPKCGLLNPDIALRCDCGWDFETGSMQQSYLRPTGGAPVAAEDHGLVGWYVAVLKKYAEFDGRARRREYWLFVLANVIIGFALALIEVVLFGTSRTDGLEGLLPTLYFLAILVPNLAVTVRRLHDVDRSGWWLLIVLIPFLGAIALLAFTVTEGTVGPNQFGLDPKGPPSSGLFSTAAR